MRVLQSCNGARFTQLRGALRSSPHCTTTHVDREQQRFPRGVGGRFGEFHGILTAAGAVSEYEDAGPRARHDGRESRGAQRLDEPLRLGIASAR